MPKKKIVATAAVDTRKVHTVFITRDSNAFGELSERVDVWTTRPFRSKLTHDAGYVWLPEEAKGQMRGRNADELGHVRSLPVKYARERYATIPDTDRECIRCMVIEPL